jgi:hypothetical protein
VTDVDKEAEAILMLGECFGHAIRVEQVTRAVMERTLALARMGDRRPQTLSPALPRAAKPAPARHEAALFAS